MNKKTYNFGKLLLMAISSGVVLSACTADFEDINKNRLLPDAHQKTLDGLASAGLYPGFMQNPIPVGTGVDYGNTYQVIQNMASDNWVGYFSPGRNHWDGGLNQTSYYISDGRANGTFRSLMEKVINPYFEIKAATHDVVVENGKVIYKEKGLIDQSLYSVAQIVKVLGIHRATDAFGPIPYTQLEPGKMTVPYDSQEVVYKTFLKELSDAVNILQTYRDSGGANILVGYDPLYQGNVSKWIKLGNSLMLRLAMRIRYADEATSREYVIKATTHQGGLIEEIADIAQLQTNGRYIFHNSLVTLLGYGELKMGATIYSYLKGYNDPRAEKYFTKVQSGNTQDFVAVRSGLATTTSVATYERASVPVVEQATPTYLFKASETKFLLAEAALVGFVSTKTAKAYYEEGIATSFEENGVSRSVAASYASTSGVPANFNDIATTANNHTAPSTINKRWDSHSSTEEHLEQIITQKYLANFPNGFEAWSEWRRTGYPRMMNPVFNLSNVSAENISNGGTDKGMRRYPFPRAEFELNSDNVMQARTLLNGADNAATNVWWDKKTKN